MAWWKKALKIGGAAAQGFDQTAREGLAPRNVTGSLVNRRKKQGWKTLGDDPANEAESKERYSPHWEDTENGDI